MKEIDGIADFDFLVMLIATCLLSVVLKTFSGQLSQLLSVVGLQASFFKDHSMDAYLLGFILVTYLSVLYRNTFGLPGMKPHRLHQWYMTFGCLILSMFLSLGYKSYFVGDVGASIQRFNVGLTAFLAQTFKSASSSGELLSNNLFNWIVTGFSCLLVFFAAPAVVKSVDAFRINRKCAAKLEADLEKADIKEGEQESSRRLLRQYTFGGRLQIASIVLQSLVLLLHIKSAASSLFGRQSPAVQQQLTVGLAMASLLLEMYSTHLEIKNRSHYVFEVLVHFKPTTQVHKRLFIDRCYQTYRESVRQMLHAMSKAVLPALLLLFVFMFLRKQTERQANHASLDGTILTQVEWSPVQILRSAYACPADRSRQVVRVVEGFAVVAGRQAVDLYSKQPFTIAGDLSLGDYTDGLLLNLFRLVFLNFQVCKYLLQVAYIIVVTATNEEVE